MKKPEEINLTKKEGHELIKRIGSTDLTSHDKKIIIRIIEAFFWLNFALTESKISLKRLKSVLFGRTNPNKKIKQQNNPKTDDDKASDSDDDLPPPDLPSIDTPEKPSTPRYGHRKGQGRTAIHAYVGAEEVFRPHDELQKGSLCPSCLDGSLYGIPPGKDIRFDSQGLITAISYELEKLRCSSCGEVFTASLPDSAGDEKYSHRAKAALAVNHYYLGVPFYRIQALQAMLGVPLPDATQYDLVEQVADSVYPVYNYLVYLSAQAKLFYHDDTSVVIQLLKKENKDATTERKGMYTTVMVSEGEQTIVLYVSGRQHAGENLAELMASREETDEIPIQMCDASSNNTKHSIKMHLCHCLAHALRQFSDIEHLFPDICHPILKLLGKVYKYDAETRKLKLDEMERLAYHQKYSKPLMDTLKEMLTNQLKQHQVEPNSSLGKAFNYLLKRWDAFTQFLKIPSAPLDNNVSEQALKLMIRQRKNSLFFVSNHSAYIANILTSLIETCIRAGGNALDYLTSLQEHRHEVFQNPSAWLPWNYNTTEPISC